MSHCSILVSLSPWQQRFHRTRLFLNLSSVTIELRGRWLISSYRVSFLFSHYSLQLVDCCKHFCLCTSGTAHLFCVFSGSCNPLIWGVDTNGLMESDQKFAHHELHCHSKPKKVRPRHLHQSTLHFGEAAPCYITTHKQVPVKNASWSQIIHSQSAVVSFCPLVFVRVILGGQLTDVLCTFIWETPASPPSIRPGWISVTSPHRCSGRCSHTLKRCTATNKSVR